MSEPIDSIESGGLASFIAIIMYAYATSKMETKELADFHGYRNNTAIGGAAIAHDKAVGFC